MALRPLTVEVHVEAVGRVVAAMRAHPCMALDLAAMAEIAAMSRFHFLRVFVHVTGITPARFLAALRMEQAKRLLLQTTQSVTSVCYEVGYGSLGTFTRQFTELVGTSPAAFRQRMTQLRDRPLAERLLSYEAPSPSGPSISGGIETPSHFDGYLFLGIFPSPIPQGRPSSAVVLTRHRRYELPFRQPAGTQYLLVAGFSSCAVLINPHLPTDTLVGCAALCPGHAPRQQDIALRPLTSFDPPILSAIPLFVAELRPEVRNIREAQ
jgi:AraC-like DNA-binding protein